MAVLPLFCVYAPAGPVFVHQPQWSPDPREVTVKLKGDITDGLVRRVKDEIRHVKADGRTVLALELESYGGNGNAGMALAEYIHQSKIPVYIPYSCYSACASAAMAALGGKRLAVSRYAKVGVHAAADVLTGDPMPGWTRAAAQKLRKYGAPRAMTRAMVETPHVRMTVFEANKLKAFGAEVK